MTPTITQHDPTTMTVDAADTTEPIIRMTRMFDAPRALVWRVFTDPKHVARWYGGHGIENPVCEMDVRAGGLWRHVMRFPDGTEFPLELVFVEVKAREAKPGKEAFPEENITPSKLRKLSRIAEGYLREKRREATPYRFDAVLVVFRDGIDPEIRHFRSIFI